MTERDRVGEKGGGMSKSVKASSKESHWQGVFVARSNDLTAITVIGEQALLARAFENSEAQGRLQKYMTNESVCALFNIHSDMVFDVGRRCNIHAYICT